MIPIDKYETQSMSGKYVPITPNGHDIPLTFANRVDYFNKALEFRLHELDKQVWTSTFIFYNIYNMSVWVSHRWQLYVKVWP